jgi:hypothetical protein
MFMRLLLSVLLSVAFASSAFASGIYGIADVYEPDSLLEAATSQSQENKETNKSDVVSIYLSYLQPSLHAELFESLRLGVAQKDGKEVVGMDTQRRVDIQVSALKEIMATLKLAQKNQWMVAVDNSYRSDKENPLMAASIEHVYVPLARVKAKDIQLVRSNGAIDIRSKSEGARLARVCKDCNSLALRYIMDKAQESLDKAGDKEVILDLRIVKQGESLQTKRHFFQEAPEKELFLDPRKLYTQVKVTDSEQSIITLPQAMILNSGIIDVNGENVIGQEMIAFSQVINQAAIPDLSYTIKDEQRRQKASEVSQRFYYIYAGMSAFENRVNKIVERAIRQKKMIAFTPLPDDRFALALFRVSEQTFDENAIVSFDSSDEASKRAALLSHLRSQVKAMDMAVLEERFYSELQGLTEEEKLDVLAEIMLNNNGEMPSKKQVLKKRMIKNYMEIYHPDQVDQSPVDVEEIENPEFEYDLQEVDSEEEVVPVTEESYESSLDEA